MSQPISGSNAHLRAIPIRVDSLFSSHLPVNPYSSSPTGCYRVTSVPKATGVTSVTPRSDSPSLTVPYASFLSLISA